MSAARLLLLLTLLALASATALRVSAAGEEAGDLSPDAVSARDDAREILRLPVFRKGGGAGPLERLGRAALGALRRLGDLLRRAVGFEHGTALATVVSGLVLAGAALLLLWLWRSRPRRSGVRMERPLEASAPEVEARRFLPLGAAEEAFARGDLAGAAALVTDWFLARAYEPGRPPDWRTNRELLPDLRPKPPLRAEDWEALVTFHEALRYAGARADARVVGAWLERAREGSA